MNSKKKFLLGMCTAGFLVLAGCGNAPNESNAALDKNVPDQNTTENTNEDPAETDSAKNDSSAVPEEKDKDGKDTGSDEKTDVDKKENEGASKNESENKNEEKENADSETETVSREDISEKATNSTTVQNEEATPTEEAASRKAVYLEKLHAASTETEELRNNPADSSTYAMKNVEGNNFDTWDGLLNEIYQVLENQLSQEDMEQVRQDQREWINYRDSSAKEASLKYEGGTEEQLEYTTVLVNLTEERCFELLENYMK
ncbi:lysozyme inhibitor LprI family protein [Terribacillus saccharophilus]|uniref:lysozyme inhibitor LprI family protein n=1 Tax=Terribacillus saccharophilus TaxID=361277 RepID=UPI003981B4AB